MATLRKLPTMVAVAAFTAALSGCGGNDGKLVRDLEDKVKDAEERMMAAEAAQLAAETAQTDAEAARMTAETMATAAATRADEAEQAQMAAEMRRDEAVDAEMAAQEAQMAAQEAQMAAEMRRVAAQEAQMAAEMRRDEAVAAEAAAVTARMIAQEAQMAAVTARNEADAAARASAADAAEKAREAAVAQARADAAMDAQMTAKQARDDAVAAQRTAEQERDDAMAAQRTAEQERDDAVAAQRTAEQERDDAVAAQMTAQQERDDAVAAQMTAEQERDDAVKKYEDLRDKRDTQAADTARKKRLARGTRLYNEIRDQRFVGENAHIVDRSGTTIARRPTATVLQHVPGKIRDIRGMPVTDAEIVVERTLAAPDMVEATLESNMSLKPTGTAQAGMATADGSWSDVAIEWELVPDDQQALTEYADNVIMVYSDIEAPEESRVLMTNDERADGYKKVFPEDFDVLKHVMLDNPPSSSVALELERPTHTARRSIRGEYRDIPGTLECRGVSTCTFRLNADGKLTLTGGSGVLLHFRPDDANATYIEVDSHYLRFGWWAEASASVISELTLATVSETEVFVGEIGGTTGTDVARADEIKGTASYVGPAAGKYVTFDKVAGVRTDADVGYFTATATLTANFDSDAPTPTTHNEGYGIISGSVRGFEGADGEAKPWLVTLNETGFTKSGAIGYAGPGTPGTADDREVYKNNMPVRNSRLTPSDHRMNPSVDVSFSGGSDSRTMDAGYWLGQFYYQNESNTTTQRPGDPPDVLTPVETYAPGAVGGIFDAQTSEGNLLGAFGALLQE